MNAKRKLQIIEELHAVSRRDEAHFFKKLEALNQGNAKLPSGFFGKIFRKMLLAKRYRHTFPRWHVLP